MAAALPAKLKTADIPRFAKRAAQLEKFRPIVTYWCEYYILQQILSKQLHAADDECSNYAVQLMDKLEKFKAENASNDAIVDDVAAKAYMENFGLETFQKADNAQRANKVTVQTADTFQAASTFLDVVSIWGEVDKEISAKSKFAKFHAMRILKAIKAGEDPNASNPLVEEIARPAEDGIEAELNELEKQESSRSPAAHGAPDGTIPSRTDSLPPGPVVASSSEPHSTIAQDPTSADNVTPPVARAPSIGGGYFPTIPSDPSAPDVNMVDSKDDPTVQPPAASQPHVGAVNPQDFYNTNAPPPEPITSPDRPHRPSPLPSEMTTPPPTIPAAAAPPPPAATYVPQVPAAPVQQPSIGGVYRTDDESTMAAQKHARWAISALNFEDVNTAVKELRLALQSLGAA